MMHFQRDVQEAERTGAENVRWDLSDLYDDEDRLKQDLKRILEEASGFGDRYHGRVAELDAGELADAMETLGDLHDRMGRAFSYAYLKWSTNTEDPARGALLQHSRESYSQYSQAILFFELEWSRLEDDQASALLADDRMAPFRHYLEVQRLLKPHLLSEPEEKILAEKSVTGNSAWIRFFDELLGAARFELRGEQFTEQEVLAKLHDADRSIRRDAAASLTDGLRKRQRELTYIFNTVLADKASDDRLRGFETWISSRNLSNEISDETVGALVEAVTTRYDLVERYYMLKKRLLRLDELHDYDRYAPIDDVDRRYQWREARDLVTESYARFHQRAGDIVEEFFSRNWIDAAVVPGKRGGAFSHGTVPSAHPYILMNYTGKIRDVQTLAHELGHGVHQHLSRKQGVFHADTPLTTAETASVFGEMLVFKRLSEAEPDDRNRLAMLAGKIDDTMATVFRQVAMNRFEDRIHTARRDEGELPADRFSEFWLETQRSMYRGSVTLGEHYAIWWSYIPHFLHTPGYVYAYAFGELLVLSLYNRYERQRNGFSDRYIKLLEAGGSDWPDNLVGELGVDLSDPSFWTEGLAAVEQLISEAEALADRLDY